MHVRAAVSFQAEALDVELAGQFDEIVVALHMFQLTVVTLQKDGEKQEKRINIKVLWCTATIFVHPCQSGLNKETNKAFDALDIP